MKYIMILIFLVIIIPTSGGQEKLEVEGAVKIGNTLSMDPEDGTIRWSGSDLQVWNGHDWISLTQRTGSLTDIDGNIYQTVKIGMYEWMAENLRTSKYRDGTSIPQISDNTEWSNATMSAWCWYNNSNINERPYGKLYNWYAVNDEKGLCPTGWQIPSDAEWTILTDLFGGLTVAGGPLKHEGTRYWDDPNYGATNESGFTALPAGIRFSNGSFFQIGQNGFWWTDTPSSDNAWFRGMLFNDPTVNRDVLNQNYGTSVRCVKN